VDRSLVSSDRALEALMAGVHGSDIDALFKRPAWQKSAACRGQGSDIFFGSGRGAASRAMALCEGCPVAAECRAAAVATGEVGVWGGTTAQQRRDGVAPVRVVTGSRYRAPSIAI
jgi:hypothetical protein